MLISLWFCFISVLSDWNILLDHVFLNDYYLSIDAATHNHSNDNSLTDVAYNQFIANNINSLSEVFDFHPDHDQIQSPSSEYVTESQFKNITRKFTKDTFALKH